MAESKQEVGGRDEKVCQPCLYKDIKRSADVFCPTCNEFQCTDCTNVHKMYAFMRDHTLLSVEEGLSKLDTHNVDMKGTDFCKKHNKPFEYYCEDDKALACSKCAIIDHRSCKKIVDTEDITESDQCDALREKLRTAITTMHQAVENLIIAESYLFNDIQSVLDKLPKMKTNILQTFDDFADKVTKVANSYRDKTTTDWTKRKLECETKLQTMKSSLKTIDKIASNGTPSQLFITARNLTEAIQDDVKNADSLCTDLLTLNVSCKFDEEFDTLKKSLVSAMKPDEFELNYSVPKTKKLEPIGSIELKQSGDNVKDPLYSGLDFLHDGRLVAVDSWNCECLLYDGNLNLQCTYKVPYRYPRCVVVVSDEEVAITSGSHRLDFLHVSKSNEITLKRTYKVNVKYFSISMKDDENFYVSTVNHNAPIHIVSMSGEEKDVDIVFPLKKYSIATSSCTYIRGQDKVVLTDRHANTVYIYDVKTGEKVVMRDELIKAPHGVAVGPCDHVFVCSRSTGVLVEITPAGRVVSSHQADISFHSSIAVSKDRRRLAVSDSENGSHKLKLYQILSE